MELSKEGSPDRIWDSSAELDRETLTLDQMQTDEWLMSKESIWKKDVTSICQSQPTTSVSIRREAKMKLLVL